MDDPDHSVMFGIQQGSISETPKRDFSSDEIDVHISRSQGDLIVADYDYESDPDFGSSTESSGMLVFDKNTSLTAVTTRYDRPKARQIFEALEEALEVSFRTPNLTPADEHDVYKTHGFDSINGYTISFKEKSKTFDITQSMGQTLDPEDKAEERAKFSNERLSDDMVHEIARDAMDDGMYIWTCDLHIEGYTVGFSDPIRFTRISDEFLDEIGFEKLFDIARDAIR